MVVPDPLQLLFEWMLPASREPAREDIELARHAAYAVDFFSTIAQVVWGGVSAANGPSQA